MWGAITAQTRTTVLNGDLKSTFKRWYPGLKIEMPTGKLKTSSVKLAA